MPREKNPALQEAGRKGQAALKARFGNELEYREYMSEIGARGFQAYADAHHNGCAERAAFALQRGGKLQITWRQADELPRCYCVNCNVPHSGRCPKCGQDPLPF